MEMSDREQMIAAAALRVFSRYGLSRTTMADVAEEAGVVRQTLYNVFATKNDVIGGTVRYYMGQLHARVREEWETAPSLDARLDILFRVMVVDPWDMLRATPDAGDLEAGTHPATRAALREAEERGEQMLTDLFKPNAEALGRAGETPSSLAAGVMRAMLGVKHGAESREDLLALLGTLKTMIRATLGEAQERDLDKS
jgi:AcrR family transcriptional regulator